MSDMLVAMLLTLKDMASGPLGKFGSNLTALGATARGLGHQLVNAMEAPIKSFMTAEDASIRLESTMMRSNGQVASSFGKVNDLAVQLGNKLPGTTADFQNMFAVLQQNKIAPETILGGLGEATANLAVLLKQDFSTMATSMSQMSKAAGISAKDMLPFADTLQKIAHQGVSVTDMGYAFAKSSGALQRFGIQGNKLASEFAPVMTSLIQLGHSGETVGTNLNAMMVNLFDFERGASKQAKQAQQSLKAMGIEIDIFDNKTGNLRGPREMIKELEKLKNLSKEKQADVLSKIFGSGQDADFAQALISGGVAKYDELVKDAEKQAKLNQRIAKVLTSLTNILDAATGTFQNTMAAFIEPIAPELKKLADGFGKLAEKAGAFMKAHPELTKFAAGFTLLSGAALVTGGSTVMGLGMAMNAASAAAPAFTKMGEHAGKLKNKMGDAAKGVKTWNTTTGNVLKNSFLTADLGVGFKNMASSTGNSLKQVGNSMKAMPTNAGNSLRQVGTALSAMPTNAGNALRNVGGAMRAMPGRLGGAITALPGTLKTLGATAFGKIGGGLRAIAWGIRGISLAALANPVGLLIAGIAIAVAATVAVVYKYWKPITGFFKGLWRGLSAGLSPLKPAFDRAFKAVSPLIMPIVGALKGLWNWLKNLLTPVDDVGNRGQKMGVAFGMAIAGMIKKAAEFVSAFLAVPGQMYSIGANIINSLKDGVMSAWGALKATLGDIAGQIASTVSGVLGIKSPSRVFMGFGVNLGQGLEIGMSGRLGQLKQMAGQMASAATPSFPNLALPALNAPSGGALPLPALRRPMGGLGNAGSMGSSGAMVVHFSPVIQLTPGSPAGQQVEQALQASYPEFQRMMDRYKRDSKRIGSEA